MKIPDRWLAYSALGKCIAGTRFICFKVPLKDALCNNLQVHERFTPRMLMDQCPRLGLVIDLTNTNRYYSGDTFKAKGIQYKKLQCPGQVIPPAKIVQEFFNAVDSFLDGSPRGDKLIGVHCTHGLNRTGYFICRYLTLRMGFTPRDAISAFERARGYKIERQPYIDDILAGKAMGTARDENPDQCFDQFYPQANYQDGFDPKPNHSYRQNGVIDGYNGNFVPPGPRYPHNANYQPPPAVSPYDNYRSTPADTYVNYQNAPAASSYKNHQSSPAGAYDNYPSPSVRSYENYRSTPADTYDIYQNPPAASSYKNHQSSPAGAYDNYPSPSVSSYDNYQSPLAGSYDDYEAPSRYSRGYGNPRDTRGRGYQGYSQVRNNPYGRPSNNPDTRRGPYKQEVGRYGNKKWERTGDNGRGRPRGNRSER